LIGVECQHCIRRGLLTAEALKARHGDSRTLEEASTVASAALAASCNSIHDALCRTRLQEHLSMVRRRGNPFANTLKRLPHKALLRRDEPLLPSDNDEVVAVIVSIAAGAEYLAYAGTRGDELYCRVFCFDTAEKARAMQAWIDASGIASRPAPGPSNFPQLKVGRRS
jgi:hypothetical protein